MPIKPSVRPVTPFAQVASDAPVRPARCALRWTVSEHDFPQPGFERIFLGTK